MTTNYVDTFIEVAEDCPVTRAEVPVTTGAPTIAALQYELIAGHPYEHTSDDVLFEVHARRRGIADDQRQEERDAFFATPQACLRASPLGKRYGWGIHHDADARVALVAVESDRYRELAGDDALAHRRAMRSRRASR